VNFLYEICKLLFIFLFSFILSFELFIFLLAFAVYNSVKFLQIKIAFRWSTIRSFFVLYLVFVRIFALLYFFICGVQFFYCEVLPPVFLRTTIVFLISLDGYSLVCRIHFFFRALENLVSPDGLVGGGRLLLGDHALTFYYC
jgi:hypothetical protein